MAGLADVIGAYQGTLKGFSDLENQKLMRQQRQQALEEQQRRAQIMQKYPELQVGGPLSQNVALMHMFPGAPTSQQDASGVPVSKPISIPQYLQAMAAKESEPRLPPGIAGQVLGYQRAYQSLGPGTPQAEQLKQAYDQQQEQQKALIERNKMLAGSQWLRLFPAQEKTRIISTAVGLGIDPSEVAHRLIAGQTLKQIAQEQGKNLSEVMPVYPLQGEEIKQTRNRSAFVNEIASLERNLNEGLLPYSHLFAGYSPKQIADSISNKDPDAQGRFLAARALQPELAAVRAKAMGGQVGIEAIRDLTNAALGNIKTIASFVSPEAREAMNKYISKWTRDASDSYNNTIYKSAALGQQTASRVPRSVDVPRETFRIPSFDNKQQFQKWYKSLSASDKDKVRSRLRG